MVIITNAKRINKITQYTIRNSIFDELKIPKEKRTATIGMWITASNLINKK